MSIIRSAQATFSCVFQSISWLFPPYEHHIFVHDKISLCLLRLTDLSIHKQRKTQASWVSAADSYGEKSLPTLQLHFAPQQWCHVQTTYTLQKLFRNGLKNMKVFKVFTWLPNSPDFNQIENILDELDQQIQSIDAPPHNL